MKTFKCLIIFVPFCLLGATVASLMAQATTLPSPPEPALQSTDATPALKESCITMSITANLADVANIVNSVAPTSFSDTWYNTTSVPTVVWHGIRSHVEHRTVRVPPHVDYTVSRETIQLSNGDERVAINFPVHAHAKEEPGGVEGYADGTAHGSCSLTVNPDFTLALDPSLEVSLDDAKINVLIGRVSIKDFAQRKANEAVNSMKGRLNDDLSKAINLRNIALQAWDKLPGCIAAPGTSNVWIRLAPKAVALDGPHPGGDVITADLTLVLAAETFLQADMPTLPPRIPLPNLTTSPDDKDFRIALPVTISLDELNRQLSMLVQSGSPKAIDLGGGYTATLKDASFLPKSNRLFLKVGFECDGSKSFGSVEGIMFIEAKPRFDPERQVLSFTDTDFTLDTKGTLQDVALEYTSRLLKPVLLEEIQRRLTVDVSSVLEKARNQANKMAEGINLPAPLKLDFKLQSLRAQGIDVRGNALCVEFDASGTAKISY